MRLADVLLFVPVVIAVIAFIVGLTTLRRARALVEARHEIGPDSFQPSYDEVLSENGAQQLEIQRLNRTIDDLQRQLQRLKATQKVRRASPERNPQLV